VAEVRLALAAMRTRFELVLQGGDAVSLRAAGEEALHEIAEAERLLSRFRRDAVVAHVNREAAQRAVPVPPALRALLARCRAVHASSEGAFDPTATADGARLAMDGLSQVACDEEGRVRFLRADVTLDFGGVGKGYALDRAADVLEDAGIAHALLHGGTSTVLALGPRADGRPWPLGVPDPDVPDGPLAWRGELDRCALSVSSSAHVPSLAASARAAGDGHSAAGGRTRVAVARVPFAADSRSGDEGARADAWSTALVAAGHQDLEIRDCA